MAEDRGKYPVRFVTRPLFKFRIHEGIKAYDDIETKKMCIREIVKNFSGPRRLENQRKAISQLYLELAWTAYVKRNRLKAIAFITHAVLLYPRKMHRYDQRGKFLIRTLLPECVLDRIRRSKPAPIVYRAE